jgi:hypothetical protein
MSTTQFKKENPLIAQFDLNNINIILKTCWVYALDNYVKGYRVVLRMSGVFENYVREFDSLVKAQIEFVELMNLATKNRNKIINEGGLLKYIDKDNKLYTVDFSPSFHNLLIIDGHGVEISREKIHCTYVGAKKMMDKIVEKTRSPKKTGFFKLIFNN